MQESAWSSLLLIAALLITASFPRRLGATEGDLYVTDTNANLIYRQGPTDPRFIFAGITSPRDLAVDTQGNLYEADFNTGTIFKFTPDGAQTIVSSNLQDPIALTFDSAGNLYVAEYTFGTVFKITPSGAKSVFASGLNQPDGLAVDSGGNVFVAEFGGGTILKFTSGGTRSTFASGLSGPAGLVFNSAGNLYEADSLDGTIYRFTPDGARSARAGELTNPVGLAVNPAGDIFVSDAGGNNITKFIELNSRGFRGSNFATGLNNPHGMACNAAGNLFVADQGSISILKFAPNGTSTVFPIALSEPTGLAFDNQVNLYVSNSNSIIKISRTGSRSVFATGLNSPAGLACDSGGNVFVADIDSGRILKFTPDGASSVFASGVGLAGLAFDGSGDLFADTISSIEKFTLDGTKSTFTTAGSRGKKGLAFDATGNLLVADSNSSALLKFNSSGAQSSFGSGLAGPVGVAIDTANNVFVAQPGGDGQANGSVIKFTPSGSGSTFSTGFSPEFLAFEPRLPVPIIVSPLSERATTGIPFVYQIFATAAPTSYSANSLPPGLSFNALLGAIVGTPTQAGTSQVSLGATNSAGPGSATLTLTLQQAPSSGPVVISGAAATGRTGQPFNLQVATMGAVAPPTLSATALPPKLIVNAVTGLISGTPAADGSYETILTVSDGAATTSASLELTFTSDPGFPVITSPNTVTIIPGENLTYAIEAPVNTDPTTDPTSYDLVGTLPPGLSFDSKSGTISGACHSEKMPGPPDPKSLSGGIISNVQLFAKNSLGTGTLPLLFSLPPLGTVNISTRIAVGTGDDVLIGGFIITGNAPKQVIVRAIGPSLQANGSAISGSLQDPILELHDGSGAILGSNDNWRDSQENEIIATTIPPADDRESAIVAQLVPGSYTAVIAGKDNTTGIAVVEVYDLGTASFDVSSKAQLAEISTRGTVRSGDDVMIGGFIISGAAAKVIVRAIGPELNATVPGALQDTTLELHDGSGATVASNDDWRSTQEQAPSLELTLTPYMWRTHKITAPDLSAMSSRAPQAVTP